MVRRWAPSNADEGDPHTTHDEANWTVTGRRRPRPFGPLKAPSPTHSRADLIGKGPREWPPLPREVFPRVFLQKGRAGRGSTSSRFGPARPRPGGRPYRGHGGGWTRGTPSGKMLGVGERPNISNPVTYAQVGCAGKSPRSTNVLQEANRRRHPRHDPPAPSSTWAPATGETLAPGAFCGTPTPPTSVGIDVSAPMLDVARSRLAGFGVDVPALRGRSARGAAGGSLRSRGLGPGRAPPRTARGKGHPVRPGGRPPATRGGRFRARDVDSCPPTPRRP